MRAAIERSRRRSLSPLTVQVVVALFALLARPAGGRAATVDSDTLTGKVMCGYQGWFNCQEDGADLGWTHWARRGSRMPGPGNITVDLWPDLSEYGPDERFPTRFRHADGRGAEVFSSYRRPTVLRHFQWMRDYGIDGAFVQRFANGIGRRTMMAHKDAVLDHCRAGAEQSGRVYAVMYDLSGLPQGGVARVRADWLRLRRETGVTRDATYLKHEGKPLVAVWGIGFGDGRAYTVAECRDLVRFLKEDGCSVMVGVPTGWRVGERDAVRDPALQAMIAEADVVSPWTVGRYRSPDEATDHAATYWRPDLAWCEARRMDYLPVVFPGFSWSNLKPGEDLDAIPRRKGRFLWSQFVAAKRAGCRMVYVAMFDEVDEGTAIFKCTNTPPVGPGADFLTYEGLPSDFYLRLAGAGGRMLRGEIPASDRLPLNP